MTPKLPPRTIGFRKRRIFIFVSILLIICSLCILLLLMRNNMVQGFWRSFLGLISIVTAAFLPVGIIGLYQIKKERFVGLYLSNLGMNDISTGHSYGMVQWQDVYRIKVAEDLEHPRYKYIILKVKDPQKYIDREVMRHKRRSMVLKFHYYGSPICFSNRELNCSFEELYKAVTQYYENYTTREQERVQQEANL